MECLDCSWTQLEIGILVNAIIAAIITILFKFVIIPRNDKLFERNYNNALIGTLGFLNSFDDYFRFFYEIFESKVKPIKDLPKDEWKPSGVANVDLVKEGTMNDYYIELRPFTPDEVKLLSNFEKFDKMVLKNYEQSLRGAEKEVLDYMNQYIIYIDPVLRRYIQQYMTWTIFYVEWLRRNQNYKDVLYKRMNHAYEIINFLRKEETFKEKFTRFIKRETIYDFPHVGYFIKKWDDYVISEQCC